jgi:hypothetical protein
MKIGDIDVPTSILDLEHRMLVLEQLIEHVAMNNANVKFPSKAEFEKFKVKALEALQKKYPGMGITKKN